ncbi:MAG: preprotein translocase subunit YajC [Ruminococcus sp.]|nr:preprotein translocase subunit YajC [Ruminococcus sp.]MBR2282967.1 preprotein translocase subunit YajC [Ruminococcus sp.]
MRKNRLSRLIVSAGSAVSAIAAASAAALSSFAEESADAAEQTTQGSSLMTLVLPLVFMFIILYFMAIRPQKKQEQQLKDLQNSTEIGDEIVTRGGIVGIVVRKGEDNVVIETGGEKNKLRIKTWAIDDNVTARERAAAASGKKPADTGVAAAGLADEGEKKSKKKKKDGEDAE